MSLAAYIRNHRLNYSETTSFSHPKDIQCMSKTFKTTHP